MIDVIDNYFLERFTYVLYRLLERSKIMTTILGEQRLMVGKVYSPSRVHSNFMVIGFWHPLYIDISLKQFHSFQKGISNNRITTIGRAYVVGERGSNVAASWTTAPAVDACLLLRVLTDARGAGPATDRNHPSIIKCDVVLRESPDAGSVADSCSKRA